ncbi:MAG TPA: hypothetical protein VGH79_12285 [Gaiellaceae bacterium]|jgi:hypothetical protein
MLARLLALLAIVVSLVAFILVEYGTVHWWVFAMSSAAFVLVILAVVAALLAERGPSLIVVWAQVLAVAAAVAFVVVGIVTYYDNTAPFSNSGLAAARWLGQAEVLSVAVLAFGLTLVRRRTMMAAVVLAIAVVTAISSGTYAITLTEKANAAASTWWQVATVGAFLAAAAAAGLNRGGSVAPSSAE